MNETPIDRFALILAAAGQSSRFAGHGEERTVKKTFVRLGGKPVWLCCAETFCRQEALGEIIVVVAPDDIGWFRQYYAQEIDQKLILVVPGGENRVDSIRSGLAAVSANMDYVAIHDAARPCVSDQEIRDVLFAAQKYGAAILATPVIGTVKKVIATPAELTVERTVPREGLWEAQTPQVFRRELILEAYRQNESTVPTDDAQLVEMLGHPVHIVPADRRNIKITTQSDLMLAQYFREIQEREITPSTQPAAFSLRLAKPF